VEGLLYGILLSTVFCTISIQNTQTDDFLSKKDKDFLLALARATLHYKLKYKQVPELDETLLSEAVKKNAACFVTLNKKGTGLRGCIGMFEATTPLYKNVISRAIAAALSDPRFPPVKFSELDDIKIEISVLTEPKPLKFDSPEDLLSRLRPNIDGVILETPYGFRRSTFLPQVWEQLPDKEQFLAHLCMKHYAPADAWKRDYKRIKVETYQAIVFHENEYGLKVVGEGGAKVGKNGAIVLGNIFKYYDDKPKGGFKLEEGTQLSPGDILTPDSDIIELK